MTHSPYILPVSVRLRKSFGKKQGNRERMPIKDPAVLERHLAALRKAGLK
jgi:hypothetical protein